MSSASEDGRRPIRRVLVSVYDKTGLEELVRALGGSGAGPDEIIEQIDIGGPAMVRSAAKNHHSVGVVTSPQAYPEVIEALSAGGLTLDQRRRLAAAAFADIAAYDLEVANFFASLIRDHEPGWPRFAGRTLTLSAELR